LFDVIKIGALPEFFSLDFLMKGIYVLSTDKNKFKPTLLIVH